MPQSRRPPAALLVLAALASGCGIGALHIEARRSVEMAFWKGPQVGGDALVYLDGDAVVRVRGGEERRVALARPCNDGVSPDDSAQVLVDPEGEHAIVRGTRALGSGLFHHGGGHAITVLFCWVDFTRGTAEPVITALPGSRAVIDAPHWKLGSGRLYAWYDTARPASVTELPSGETAPIGDPGSGMCDVVERSSIAVLVCLQREDLTRGTLQVEHVDVSARPPKQVEHFTLPVERPSELLRMALTPDGERLVYAGYGNADENDYQLHDSIVVGMDLRRRTRLFIEKRRERSTVVTLGIASSGRAVMVAEEMISLRGDHSARLRVLSMTGATVLETSLSRVADAFLPLAHQDSFWVILDEKAYLADVPASR